MSHKVSKKAQEIFWNLYTDAIDEVLINGSENCNKRNATINFGRRAMKGTDGKLTTRTIEDILAAGDEKLSQVHKRYFTSKKTSHDFTTYDYCREALNIVFRTVNAKRVELGI